MPRLFAGLEFRPRSARAFPICVAAFPSPWIDPENYHVTLRFIGDIDGMSANEIALMLFRINRKPFEVKVQGLQSFGGRKPRAVVASVEPSRPLIELQAELERLMQRLGLDPEGRKFTPHVTLARLHDASSQDVADYLSVRGYFSEPDVRLALRAVLVPRPTARPSLSRILRVSRETPGARHVPTASSSSLCAVRTERMIQYTEARRQNRGAAEDWIPDSGVGRVAASSAYPQHQFNGLQFLCA